jgi:outer membrane protein assembly factor BamB
VVYVGSEGSDGSNLYALQASNGTLLWKYSFGGRYIYSSPAVANGTVYIGSYDGAVIAFGLPGNNEAQGKASIRPVLNTLSPDLELKMSNPSGTASSAE